MYRDPMIRSYAESPPYMGAGIPIRYRWPERGSFKVQKIREEVQENGRALYCLHDPILGIDVLVECLYADEIWNEDYRAGRMLDPYQMDDFRRGGLVALMPWPRANVNDDKRWWVPNPRSLQRAVREIRQFNRSARRDLKRTVTASYHAKELENLQRAEEEAALDALASEIGQEMGEAIHLLTSPKVYT